MIQYLGNTWYNLTPHEIVVETPERTFTFPPSGQVARVEVTRSDWGNYGVIPVTRQLLGEVTGLPLPEEGIRYIVSGIVLDCVRRTRHDVVAPDTSRAIRNEAGHIVAVPGFVI